MSVDAIEIPTILSNINWFYVLIAFIVVGIIIKLFIEFGDFIISKLGIEFKETRIRRESTELIQSTAQQITALSESVSTIYSCQQEFSAQQDLMADKIDKIDEKVSNLENRMNRNDSATREMLCDKINNRFNRYMDLGGIPSDELEEFERLFNTYISLNGNGSAKVKYKYCIENLKIIPTSITPQNQP